MSRWRHGSVSSRQRQAIHPATHDMVDGNVDQLDKVANEAHDDKTEPYCTADLDKLWCKQGRVSAEACKEAEQQRQTHPSCLALCSGS